jgi:hypothetical protein
MENFRTSGRPVITNFIFQNEGITFPRLFIFVCVKEDEIDRACSTNWREEECI